MSHLTLTPAIASHFAGVALRHVCREYPNKLDHVIGGPDDVLGPRALHPVFFGSFDWHSCVHGWWMLARLVRRFPDLPEAARVTALFDELLTPDHVRGELDYLCRPHSRGFERPYGWAWLLMLAAEFHCHSTGPSGRRWARTLQPLADAFARRFVDFLPQAHYPIRAGTHANTAFAVLLAHEYASVCGDARLQEQLRASARHWYGGDADCPAWEPSLDDFLSPTLIEAMCMQRVLPRPEFRAWFARFLPRAAEGEPATLFDPATVSDRTDGKIVHLDGLNLSRAWCWRTLAPDLPGEDLGPLARRVAQRHLDTSLPFVTGDYMAEHWLATFAVLALDVPSIELDRSV